jgi:hypothetical protein
VLTVHPCSFPVYQDIQEMLFEDFGFFDFVLLETLIVCKTKNAPDTTESEQVTSMTELFGSWGAIR